MKETNNGLIIIPRSVQHYRCRATNLAMLFFNNVITIRINVFKLN